MAANFNNQLIFGNASDAAGDSDYTMLRTGAIHDAIAIARGATAGTCQVKKGAAVITDAMSVNAGAGTLARATTIDNASNTLAIGDTLRVTKSAAVATWTFARLASTGYVA